MIATLTAGIRRNLSRAAEILDKNYMSSESSGDEVQDLPRLIARRLAWVPSDLRKILIMVAHRRARNCHLTGRFPTGPRHGQSTEEDVAKDVVTTGCMECNEQDSDNRADVSGNVTGRGGVSGERHTLSTCPRAKEAPMRTGAPPVKRSKD
ncbi:hypothetical protein Bbelb_011160 [Branchiostoma belcheri]|nr:hypothetical protein Bbelb_011160 [Branchiostoma belcheri]